MRRVAPTLQTILADDETRGLWMMDAMADADAELKALLSVARHARIWAATDPWPSSTDARLNALHRAIQRLDKVSGGRGTK